MSTSSQTRTRKRCAHSQDELWVDGQPRTAGARAPRDPQRPWVLDDKTKALGRRGLAQVREALEHPKPAEPVQLNLFG